MIHNAAFGVESGCGLVAGAAVKHGFRMKHVYHVECFRKGKLLWEDTFENLVVTAGLNKYLDATLKTGLAAPLWYVALVTGPGAGNTYALADTVAAHAGWAEFTTYAEATHPAWTPGVIAAGSVSNSAAVAVFTINGGGGTVGGAYMSDTAVKPGVAGTLLGVGNFTAGDRIVIAADVLNVTVTCTAT